MNIGPNKGLGFVVTELWVALVVHDDGDEAVPAVMAPNGMMVPMVAADPKRLEWLKGAARRVAQESGKKVRIVRFCAREDQEVIG